MTDSLSTNEQANCDDWTKILLHCRECGVQFQRKVKGQRYCEEHRHLAGEVIRPQDTPTSNQEVPRGRLLLARLREILQWRTWEPGDIRDAIAEIERQRDDRKELISTLKQCAGLLCEAANLNNYRNLTDEELGTAWVETARKAAALLNRLEGSQDETSAHRRPGWRCPECREFVEDYNLWVHRSWHECQRRDAVKAFAGRGPDDAEFGTAEWRRDNEQK